MLNNLKSFVFILISLKRGIPFPNVFGMIVKYISSMRSAFKNAAYISEPPLRTAVLNPRAERSLSIFLGVDFVNSRIPGFVFAAKVSGWRVITMCRVFEKGFFAMVLYVLSPRIDTPAF